MHNWADHRVSPKQIVDRSEVFHFRRMRSKPNVEFITGWANLGAVLGGLVLGGLSGTLLEHALGGSRVWQYHRTLILGVVGLFWVDLLLLWRRPQYLRLSRWSVDKKDVALAVAVGYGTQAMTSLVWPIPKANPDWTQIICMVLVSPVLEEILARGIVLRSLLSIWPVGLSIAVVTGVAAAVHFRILASILPQLAFCILYYKRRNSITNSIICHSVTNAVVLFPIIRFW